MRRRPEPGSRRTGEPQRRTRRLRLRSFVRSGAAPRALRPLLGVCAGLLLACGAMAQVERAGDYLARMDTDGDGRVSQAEYVAWMSYAFERMDRNGDGVLTPDEQPGGKGKPITLEAHRQRLAERFRRQDANGDGYLDARELAAPPL